MVLQFNVPRDSLPPSGVVELTSDRLEKIWPEVRQRVVRSLCAAGIQADIAEEAVSEAITRALARGLAVTHADDLCAWVFVVARNLVVDAGRRSRKVVPLDILPDRSDDYDLPSHVESRERLRHASRLIAHMSPRDRGALLDVVADVAEAAPIVRRDAVRQAMRRHRARLRLREALGAPAGWWLRRPRFGPRTYLAGDIVAAVVMLPLLSHSPATATGVAAQPPPVADAVIAVGPAPVPTSTSSPAAGKQALRPGDGARSPHAGPSKALPEDEARPPAAPDVADAGTRIRVGTDTIGDVAEFRIGVRMMPVDDVDARARRAPVPKP